MRRHPDSGLSPAGALARSRRPAIASLSQRRRRGASRTPRCNRRRRLRGRVPGGKAAWSARWRDMGRASALPPGGLGADVHPRSRRQSRRGRLARRFNARRRARGGARAARGLRSAGRSSAPGDALHGGIGVVRALVALVAVGAVAAIAQASPATREIRIAVVADCKGTLAEGFEPAIAGATAAFAQVARVGVGGATLTFTEPGLRRRQPSDDPP